MVSTKKGGISWRLRNKWLHKQSDRKAYLIVCQRCGLPLAGYGLTRAGNHQSQAARNLRAYMSLYKERNVRGNGQLYHDVLAHLSDLLPGTACEVPVPSGFWQTTRDKAAIKVVARFARNKFFFPTCVCYKQRLCLVTPVTHRTTIIQEQVSFLKLFTLTFHTRCDLFRLALGVTVCSLLPDVSCYISCAVCNRPYGCCAGT